MRGAERKDREGGEGKIWGGRREREREERQRGREKEKKPELYKQIKSMSNV